jgi:hypothetical protein
MNLSDVRHASWTVGLLALLSLAACGPEESVIHTCVVQADCPASLSCLQQVCESVTLPNVQILSPEDGLTLPWMDDGAEHIATLSITATDLILRPLAESNEKVIGEGHLVVFVDEVEVATIDEGDLSGGVALEIAIADTPGVHRLRVQARLNDGSVYDNLEGSDRKLMWVDDGLEHVALRTPWPGDAFPLESLLINAEVAVMGDSAITIGPPASGNKHVHVFYDEGEPFTDCITNQICFLSYEGLVPSDSDEFGPVAFPPAAAGMARLTAIVMNADHTAYTYTDGMGTEQYVYSSFTIERSQAD